MTGGYELAYVIGGLFLSLTVFSLVLGDNYLFRLGAAILSGAVSAFICVLLVEKYFYPLITELIGSRQSLTAAQIIRAAAVVIGIILLFCKAYTNAQSGGRVVMIILLASSAAVLVLGAVNGTIPAFVRSMAEPFRLKSVTLENKNDVWYWLKNGAMLVSAVIALLYTRHYRPGNGRKETEGSGSTVGNVLIGFTFGALTAAVFMAAANILVNHLSGIIANIQTLIR